MSGITQISIPESHLCWNLYGPGYDNLGLDGQPERVPTPQPGPDQILARIDSVGICYSDVKLINQGNLHPKLSGRDLVSQPTRPGHEISFTVVSVGRSRERVFRVGDRYAIQPEVVLHQKKQTYGFSLPGGLTQYQLIGPELLDTDLGSSILRIDPELGFSEASLLEPWGSVLASYSSTRRLVPKPGGRMWVIGNPGISHPYEFSTFLDTPESILISDISQELEEQIRTGNSRVERQDGIFLEKDGDFSLERFQEQTFDDIVILDPLSSLLVSKAIELVNPGGLINLVGSRRLDKKVRLDPQRIHYHFVALVGNSSLDIAASYGEGRNRSDLLEDGTALILGGGGPMGQMHIQRALKKKQGPAQIVVTEIDPQRRDNLNRIFLNKAGESGRDVIIINPNEPGPNLTERIWQQTGRSVVDDLVVLVPTNQAMEQAAELVAENSLLNLFAGTPEGVDLLLDLSLIYLGNLQITGASGLEFCHIQEAYRLALQGLLDLDLSVTAVGGMGAALEAIKATERRRYPGKIIIYPGLEDLPLMDLGELANTYPMLRSYIGTQRHWSHEVEKALLNLANG
jgi:threonine dehydrogenase-like Zn-dependent dehydrogenase